MKRWCAMPGFGLYPEPGMDCTCAIPFSHVAPFRDFGLTRSITEHKIQRNINQNTNSRNAMHITDLFFQEEISSIAGSDASDQWLLSSLHSALRSQHSPPYSPRNCRREPESERPASRPGTPSEATASCTESEFDLLSQSQNIDVLGDRIGLLYTDAAHTILCELRPRDSI
jgi:hypothetical protein